MDRNRYGDDMSNINDYGREPIIVDIDCFTEANPYFRTALWTGEHLQVTLMSIPAGGDIGLEVHPHLDQFLKIESGYAFVMMGKEKGALNCRQKVSGGYAAIVPAGTWHNIVNIGRTPLKIYSIYAPPQHPFGTVHKTKAEAEEAECL